MQTQRGICEKSKRFWQLRILVLCKASLVKMRASPNDPRTHQKLTQKQSKIDARKNEAQMMPATPNMVPNGPEMDPNSFKIQLRNNPKIDVEKWTSQNR